MKDRVKTYPRCIFAVLMVMCHCALIVLANTEKESSLQRGPRRVECILVIIEFGLLGVGSF